MLKLNLFGTFQLTQDGVSVPVGSGRLQALLTRLALCAGERQPRQTIAASFWPEVTDAEARRNLRQLLHQLRQAWPQSEHYVAVDASSIIWLPNSDVDIDTQRFASLSATGTSVADLEAAVALYRGDLLASCFDDWIAPYRERFRLLLLDALKRLAAHHEAHRDFVAALRFQRQLLDLEPLDEGCWMALMRLYALAGERAAVLRAYQDYERILLQELGAQPPPALRELRDRLASDVQSSGSSGATETASSQPPLIGRQSEWASLMGAWHRAGEGGARMVVLSGEPGIGKSRLAEELLQWVARQGYAVARTRSYAAEGGLAFAPVAEWLRSPAFAGPVRSIGAVWLREMTRILPELMVEQPDLAPPDVLAADVQRLRFFEAMTRAMLSVSGPLLLVLDDLQWCDLGTVELLRFLMRFEATAKLLIVCTARSEELSIDGGIRRFLLDMRAQGVLDDIVLNRLDAAESSRLASHLLRRELEIDEALQLYAAAEGNPLFVVEMTQSGLAFDSAARDTSTVRLPPRMHALIASRIMALSKSAQLILRIGAVIGRALELNILLKACDLDESSILDAVDELVSRAVWREHSPGEYDFTHDKIREVVYSDVGTGQRRLLHRRVAGAIESSLSGKVNQVSSRLAYHYDQAGKTELAIENYIRAASAAKALFASDNVVALCHRGLALIATMPSSKNLAEQELSLLSLLGTSMAASSGYQLGDQLQVLLRSQVLAEQLGRSIEPRVLRTTAYANVISGNLDVAEQLGVRLLQLGDSLDDPAIRTEGVQLQGIIQSWRGEFEQANSHFTNVLQHYQREHVHDFVSRFNWDPAVSSLSRLAQNLWCLGFPKQAAARQREALAHVVEQDVFGKAYALFYGALLSSWLGDWETAELWLSEGIAYATEQKVSYWLRFNRFLEAWHAVMRSDGVAKLDRLAERTNDLRGFGVANLSYFSVMNAEACVRHGRFEHALALSQESIDLAARSGVRWFLAEAHRVRALALQNIGSSETESEFQRSIAVARSQRARSFELRAATDLARHWQTTGKPQEARALLAPVYASFTEGHETLNLKAAAAMLAYLD